MNRPDRFLCRAVLLDMDGTLVDSTEAVVAQWGRWAVRHGLRLEDVLKVSHGRPSFETMQIVAPDVATREEHKRFLLEEESYEGGSVEVPGAVRFVSKLPARRWAVVTSAPRNLALRRMAAVDLPPAPVLIAPEDVPRGKPDPLPYLEAARRLQVQPSECLVVEDTPPGLASARAAGMTAIGIITTYPREALECETAVRDFEALDVEIAGDTLIVRVDRQHTG